MASIVSIVPDERIRSQVEQYLRGLNLEDLALAFYKSPEEFENIYFKNERPPEKTDDEKTPIPRLEKINLIVVMADGNEKQLRQWLPSTLRECKRHRLWPEGGRTHLMLLKYEDDSVSKVDFMLPEIDDLVYLPLDRLIFLQKVEILLNLPKKIKPSFLFYQPVEEAIEISKIARVECLNDVGLAIRNPAPLKPGLSAKFYLQLPGTKSRIRFFAKAVRSVPHPEASGQFLVYFSYFGIRKNDISQIRIWLSQGSHYQAFIDDRQEAFKFNPNDMFLSEEEKRTKTVVVIDSDEAHAQTLKDLIHKDVDHCEVVVESSYNAFVHKYLRGQSRSGGPPPQPTTPEEIGSEKIVLTIDPEHKNLLQVENLPEGEALFLGHVPSELFAIGSDAWWKPFQSEENDLILDESIQLVVEKKSRGRLLTARAADGTEFALNVRIGPTDPGAEMSFEISPASKEEIQEKLISFSPIKNLDTLLIDAAFVPAEFDGWMEYLKITAHQKGMVKNPDDLHIILMSERENRLEQQWLHSSHVRGFVIKPVDNRLLLFQLAECLKSKFSIYRFDNLGWNHNHFNAHIAKEVICEAISEFGATIRQSAGFQPGSFFFLRKMIFDQAPNSCLAARVYFSEPGSEKGQFLSHVTYFGINDSFLKYARSWIRELYAASKTQS